METGGIDWAQVHERLGGLRRAVEAGGEPSPEESRRLLEERARALAEPREEQAVSEMLDAVVFTCGGERYAAEAQHVLEVVPLGELTPVPHAPAVLRGVIGHRGRVLPVFDLRRLLARPGEATDDPRTVVTVEAAGMRFGIAAESAEETARLPASGRSAVRGADGELLNLLDLEALAGHPRLRIDHNSP